MELEFETDELLASKFTQAKEKSTILLTLSSRISYDDAKIVTMYQGWKKF